MVFIFSDSNSNTDFVNNIHFSGGVNKKNLLIKAETTILGECLYYNTNKTDV